MEFAVLVAGRTGSRSRRVSIVIDAACLALLTWSFTAGPVFAAPTTDGVVRTCLVGIIAIVIIDLVMTIRREALPTRVPTHLGRPAASAAQRTTTTTRSPE